MPGMDVMSAFEARLQEWVSIGACPFVDENEVSEVPHPPFVEIEYPVSSEGRMTTGSSMVYRESGSARFVITIAAFQEGWKPQVFGWVEELRDLFRNQRFGGVTTETVSPPVIDDRNRDRNRYSVAFVVLYTFDIVR